MYAYVNNKELNIEHLLIHGHIFKKNCLILSIPHYLNFKNFSQKLKFKI